MLLMRTTATLCLLFSLASLPACSVSLDRSPVLAFSGERVEGEPFEWQGRIAPGQTLEIKGVNGPIRAVAAAGDVARVRAIRTGRRNDPDLVRIEVVEYGGGVTVCAIYPEPSSNECRPGGDGRVGSRNNDVSVSFLVEVPNAARFATRTINGDVVAEELAGEVRARTTNGDVRVERGTTVYARTTNGNIRIVSAAAAQASTTNGSITAELDPRGGTEPLTFSTTNGSITLLVPPGSDARIEARTTNGRVRSDLPLTVSGAISSRRLSADLGAGGRMLKLSTTNGSIHLKERPVN